MNISPLCLSFRNSGLQNGFPNRVIMYHFCLYVLGMYSGEFCAVGFAMEQKS